MYRVQPAAGSLFQTRGNCAGVLILCRKSEAKKTAGKGAGNKKGGGKEKKGCLIL